MSNIEIFKSNLRYSQCMSVVIAMDIAKEFLDCNFEDIPKAIDDGISVVIFDENKQFLCRKDISVEYSLSFTCR